MEFGQKLFLEVRVIYHKSLNSSSLVIGGLTAAQHFLLQLLITGNIVQ